MNKKRIIGSLVALCLCMASFAQEEYFMTGLPLDDGTYDKLERKVEFVTKGTNVVLPKQHSLLQYCPTAKSQGGHGTCTSWACAYAARTIAEAVRRGWTSREAITKEAFSPLFVYAQAKQEEDTGCSKGIHIYQALDLMKERGCVKYRDFDVLCADVSDIGKSLQGYAPQYKIDGYLTLFKLDCDDAGKKVEMVKKSLAEDRPVVIAMWLPTTFSEAGMLLNMKNVPNHFPRTDYFDHDPYHAMCVVGYDDGMEGGAFQIMNSWGKNWGKDGFLWVKYADFARCVDQAYEIIVKPLPKPDPEPVNMFEGRFELVQTYDTTSKQWMEKELKANYHGDKTPHYVFDKTLHSGDRWRAYITNKEPAYIYLISSDMKGNDNLLYPFGPYSAYMADKYYRFAMPPRNEKENYSRSIRIDKVIGTDYWCVLYSSKELDILSIMQRMKTAQGSFYDRVQAALGDKMVPQKDIRFVENKVEFSARSEKSVVAVFIEAKHR